MEKQLAYIKIVRPANVVTAITDVLAGIAISGYFLVEEFNFAHLYPSLLLCLAAIGLYSGGVIFNDVFDVKKDKKYSPGRPIPKGLISIKEASIFGGICFSVGIVSAAAVGLTALSIATLIVITALIYDKWAKHLTVSGPVMMGLCRGMNLLLGVSIFSSAPQVWWLVVATVPIIYIASITIINKRKANEQNKRPLYLAAFLYALVIACILFIAHSKGHILSTLIFVIPFYLMIFSPLFKALDDPIGKNLSESVKAGVIALILLNAAWASAFGMWYIAGLIVMLLPLSLWFSKIFATA